MHLGASQQAGTDDSLPVPLTGSAAAHIHNHEEARPAIVPYNPPVEQRKPRHIFARMANKQAKGQKHLPVDPPVQEDIPNTDEMASSIMPVSSPPAQVNGFVDLQREVEILRRDIEELRQLGAEAPPAYTGSVHRMTTSTR
ncbi:hypothetical protein C0991_006199 [Blastosporella zonata]|nr:hypothetical protein C0991_006199 [Blastosporella zonata]